MALYTRHCAPCHGTSGRGDGPAARFLHPPPRDFTHGAFRMVTTTNGVPSDKDLFEVIAGGMPGSAMLPFAHLGPDRVSELVQVVRGFHRQGVAERLRPAARSDEELAAWVDAETTPGPAVRVPPEPADSVASRARGRLHYMRNCASCHGPRGKGDVRDDLVSSEGHPVSARDLTRGVLKGGWTKAHVFQRIRCGIPGTPMPALTRSGLDARGVWDLVHFLGTIIPRGAQALHDPVRRGLRAVHVVKLPATVDDPRFQQAPEVHLALAPFRTEEATVTGISARAVHDGESLAFRVRYADPTLDPSGEGTPPDGLAVRVTPLTRPPVIPNPGLALPLDRMLWLSGAMPAPEDPVFTRDGTPFANPDALCKAPVEPQGGGEGRWTGGVWTVLLTIVPLKAEEVGAGTTLEVSFAAFDGSLRRGPLPTAFSNWHRLLLAPDGGKGDK